MATEPIPKHVQKQVDDFNKAVKVGDKVQARRNRHEPWFDVTVRYPASVLGGHTAVGWFEELSGCHSLDFVKY